MAFCNSEPTACCHVGSNVRLDGRTPFSWDFDSARSRLRGIRRVHSGKDEPRRVNQEALSGHT